MIKGITYALGACFIWGLIFVVPLFMDGFSSIEIAIGRYSFYGAISALIFFQAYLKGGCRYPFAVWLKALFFSLASTIGYYTFVVLAVRYSTPAICALILGISPITIAFYGNWMEKECSYKSLFLPSVLIIIGLVLINAPHIMTAPSLSAYITGLLCSVWALIAWSWYVVANSRFLKDNPKVASGDWSTLIGVSTLFWVGILAIGSVAFLGDQIEPQKYLTWSPMLLSFLVGCGILGLLCSWVGAFLWNKASLYLPVSLAGQLTIFETIFGICFVYTLEQRSPPMMECLGIALFLVSIAYGIRQSDRASESHVAA